MKWGNSVFTEKRVKGKGVLFAATRIASLQKIAGHDGILGNGCYGVVAKHPNVPNAVIKVGYGYAHGADYDGYSEFIRRANTDARFKGNPHLPRCAHLERFLFDDDTCVFVAVLESLNKYDFQAHHKQVRPLFRKVESKYDNLWSLREARTADAEKAFSLIATLHDEGFSNDLHTGNVMLRGDHTIVITDPVT